MNVWMILIALTLLAIPVQSSAHAVLKSAIPEAYCSLESPPSQWCYLLAVTNNKATISPEQDSLMLQLPKLERGIYTVSYKVISEDGHPVGGTYVFSIGSMNVAPMAGVQVQGGMPMHGGSEGGGLLGFAHYASRILNYLFLLALTGWIFWRNRHPFSGEHARKSSEFWSSVLIISYLISQIFVVLLQLPDLIVEWSWHDVISFFFGTNVGILWVMALWLIVFGLSILYRNKWVDYFWITLVLAVETLNGHASTLNPSRTLVLDLVHLIAAMIWTGGLLYLIVHWRCQGESIYVFIRRFSPFALGSIAALVLTGILMTFLFLTDLNQLIYTWWGILILVKSAVVLLVIGVGSILRSRFR